MTQIFDKTKCRVKISIRQKKEIKDFKIKPSDLECTPPPPHPHPSKTV